MPGCMRFPPLPAMQFDAGFADVGFGAVEEVVVEERKGGEIQEEEVRAEQQVPWGGSKPLGDINLWVGSHSDAMDMDALRERGICSIINVASDCDDHPTTVTTTTCDLELVPGRITVLRLELDDDSDAPIKQCFAAAAGFAEKTLAEGGGVLVHCQRGISRAPTVASAVLSCLGVLPLDALYSIAAVRPQVCPNLGFALALQDLQKQAKKKQVAHDCSFRAREMSTRVRQVPLAVRG